MSKTFKYIYITNEYYSKYQDSNITEGREFDYTVDDYELLIEIVDIIYGRYFNGITVNKKETKSRIKAFVDDNCLLESLVETYEDWLKDIFEEKAMEWYANG